MVHETGVIATITVGLALAFIGGFLATRLRLPPIVGYLVAGIAVGPFTPGFVADAEIAAQLAEIGVILLMFGVGVHFSLRDLLAVRAIAIPGAIVQISVATALGIGLSHLWGWSIGAGLVLGLAISVASTVVLLRALMEYQALDSTHGHIAVGWLIVEDLFTVLALVLLPVLAIHLGGDTPAGLAAAAAGGNVLVALGLTLGKVALLVAIMFFIGARLVPWLLVQVARAGSRELFTLAVLAVALGIALGSSVVFGVSLALGAFLAGLVVSESDLSHQAAADALPLRDAFAVLFFVSVGMLFDPSFLFAAPGAVLAVLAIIIVGKPLAALLIVLAFGYPVRSGLIVAAGLAQIGEFSFILAGLGGALGLLPMEGYSLVIACALLSITINPLLFSTIEPIEAWLRRHPRALRLLQWHGEGVLRLPDGRNGEELRGHAVICGYGRIGSVIGDVLRRRGFAYVVVEQNRRLVEDLRRRGIPAIYGDSSNALILDRVNLARARALVVAIPDPPAVRQIVDYARRVNPRLDIVVRTNGNTEREFLQSLGVREAVVGELETALEMTRHTLRRFGVSSTETMAILQRLRARSRGEEDQDVGLGEVARSRFAVAADRGGERADRPPRTTTVYKGRPLGEAIEQAGGALPASPVEER